MFQQTPNDEYREAWTRAQIITAGWEFQRPDNQLWTEVPVKEPIDNNEEQDIPANSHPSNN